MSATPSAGGWSPPPRGPDRLSDSIEGIEDKSNMCDTRVDRNESEGWKPLALLVPTGSTDVPLH